MNRLTAIYNQKGFLEEKITDVPGIFCVKCGLAVSNEAMAKRSRKRAENERCWNTPDTPSQTQLSCNTATTRRNNRDSFGISPKVETIQ